MYRSTCSRETNYGNVPVVSDNRGLRDRSLDGVQAGDHRTLDMRQFDGDIAVFRASQSYLFVPQIRTRFDTTSALPGSTDASAKIDAAHIDR